MEVVNMKQFLAVVAAVGVGYYAAQNFFIRIIDKNGDEVYKSPQYSNKNKKAYEDYYK